MKHQLILLALLTLFTNNALAERADREKPINIEASKISVDDIKKIQVFEGNVVLTQGTLLIRSERIVVTQDNDGFQKGTATGGPGGLAYFKQKREGKDEYIEGEGERIEYDSRREKTEFFIRGRVKSGSDEVKGNYISYDAISEKYLVLAHNDSKQTNITQDKRVRAIFQPKPKSDEPTHKTPNATSENLKLKISPLTP